jgi:glutamate racemase
MIYSLLSVCSGDARYGLVSIIVYNMRIVTDAGCVMNALNRSSQERPVAVFDSGVGGISVLKHIHALLPAEHLIYVADSQYAPYGNKTPAAIQARCFAIADFLIARNAKVLVVACNTATAAAIDAMRERYNLPIIGMEPAVKPAAEASKNGIIGVLATTGTLKSAQFAALLESYGRNVKVVTQACVGLVECIERGDLDSAATFKLLQQYCQPLLDEGADTIVLGCTHYPLVKPLIEKIVGTDIVLIDTGAAVANQLQHRLLAEGLQSTSKQDGRVQFWTNSQAAHAQQVITQLWGEAAEVKFL